MSSSWRDTIQEAPAEPKSSWRDTIQQHSPDVSPGISALRGAEQGLTMGWADELAAAAEAGGQALGLKGVGANNFDELDFQKPAVLDGLDKIKGAYLDRLEKARAEMHAAKEQNPKSYLAGEIGGGLAGGAMLPGAKALSIGRTALTGAGIGAVGGLGNSEADNFVDMAKDTAKGAAIGGTVGTLAGTAGKVLSSAQPLGEFAENRAFSALGGVKKHADAAMAKGSDNRIGRMLLDEGMITPLGSKQSLADQLENRSSDIAEKMQGLTSKVDSGEGLNDIQRFALKQNSVNPSKIAEQIKNQIRQESDMLPEAAIQSKLDAVDRLVGGDRQLSMAEANRLKRQIQTGIKENSYWKDNPGGMQDLALKTRRAVKDAIEQHGDAYANAAGDQAGQVKALNRDWGDTIEAGNIVQDRLARDTANQKFGLGEQLGATAGIASGGPIGMVKGATLAAASFIRRNYGDNMAALGADKISKILMKAQPFSKLAESNPEAFNAVVNSTSQALGGGAQAPMAASNTSPHSDTVSFAQPGKLIPEQEARDAFKRGN